MGKPTIKDITDYLEGLAPLAFQEDYDNSGLIIGDAGNEATGVLVCLDSTEEVVDEAIGRSCNLIIAHHPIIFRSLKRLTGNSYVERAVTKAIKKNIAIYAIHTNLDNVQKGVNYRIAQSLTLSNPRILSPKKGVLHKLVTFVPPQSTEPVLRALHDAGVGEIGNYSECSFSVQGTGRYKPGDDADPHQGAPGEIEHAKEDRIEVIFPGYLWSDVWKSLRASHPYEEIAYHHSPMLNLNKEVGSGMIGDLEQSMLSKDFLQFVKDRFRISIVKHTAAGPNKIRRVAVCGGAGSFLIPEAISQQADAFITADIKYHEFFDAEEKIILVDVGHYESEIGTKELIADFLKEKFNTFAVHLSQTNTNPISYS